MAEKIVFHFEGALASSHQMNFYEAARFQYAAARLVVKLDQFRSAGRFTKKITGRSNRQILLKPHFEGSFDISIIAPEPPEDDSSFVDLPLSALISYVAERLIAKAPGDQARTALNANPNVLERYGSVSDDSSLREVLRLVLQDPSIRRLVTRSTLDLFERRLAELDRLEYVLDAASELGKIDGLSEQKLLSMAAPLVSEMATALRRSADTLEVISSNRSETRSVLFLNREMASEIETSSVDGEITPILGDIIQYNKETGWGKVRLIEFESPIGFNIPSDLKAELQSTLLHNMERDLVYLQAYFVRNRSGEPIRLIVVGILATPNLVG